MQATVSNPNRMWEQRTASEHNADPFTPSDKERDKRFIRVEKCWEEAHEYELIGRVPEYPLYLGIEQA